MSATVTQRQVTGARIFRALTTTGAVIETLLFAVHVAHGALQLAVFSALTAVLFVAAAVLASLRIRLVKRTQELNRHAGRAELAERALAAATAGTTTAASLDLGFARLGAALGPCAHPGAEPVDLLLTGERVAWVCPDCNAELPAGWTPQAKGTGTLTAASGPFSATAALSGTGTLTSVPAGECCRCGDDVSSVQVRVPESAEPLRSYCLECGLQVRQRIREERAGVVPGEAIRARAYREARAAEHLEQLAKVGLESCISDCPLCAERWIEEERWGGE